MRYLKLVLLMFRTSIQNESAYRADFLLQFIGAIAHLAATLAGLWVVFTQTSSINGWSIWHMLALVGVFRIMSGLIAMIIAPNMRALMEDVRTGALDFLLLKPVNGQFLGSTRRISVWRCADMFVGLCVALIAAVRLTGSLAPSRVVFFLLMLLAGTTIIYSIWLMLATASFWLVRVQNIEMIFWNVFEAGRYPVHIYGRNIRLLLTYVLPVAFVITFPAQALVGGVTDAVGPVNWAVCAAALLLAPAAFIAATLFWRFGVRRYSGASA